MKHLKLFENFDSLDTYDYDDSSNYYTEIETAEFSRLVDNEQSIFTEEEIEELYHISKFVDHRVINYEVMIIETTPYELNITKLNDDYFIAFMTLHNSERDRRKKSGEDPVKINMDDHRVKYKCDQWDGLLKWLEDFSKKGYFTVDI